ncbi:MAG: Cys-tRNA(Pro) deacylase [Ruminococcaceae bacterium]|nr:Cys-tRNA(Pro) deacylase [Oscillospiraceae bacterium]
MKINKTNAMRQLDAAKIKYEMCEYEVDENDLSGTHIAEQIGLPFEQVFKTIVTKGDKTGYMVFCIPCHKEIDLKKAAAVTGNKKIEPLHVKDLLGITGYIRGGCSPVGMKKKFPTYFDRSAESLERLTVSAGVRGIQLLVNSDEIIKFTSARLVDITAE